MKQNTSEPSNTRIRRHFLCLFAAAHLVVLNEILDLAWNRGYVSCRCSSGMYWNTTGKIRSQVCLQKIGANGWLCRSAIETSCFSSLGRKRCITPRKTICCQSSWSFEHIWGTAQSPTNCYHFCHPPLVSRHLVPQSFLLKVWGWKIRWTVELWNVGDDHWWWCCEKRTLVLDNPQKCEQARRWLASQNVNSKNFLLRAIFVRNCKVRVIIDTS